MNIAGRYLAVAGLALAAVSAADYAYASRHKTTTRNCSQLDDRAIRNYLRGSPASLERQNRMADADGLTRIKNNDGLRRFVNKGLLIPLSGRTGTYELDGNLAAERAYVRPWTRGFVEAFARSYSERFGGPIKITSAVRPVDYQVSLRRTNPNAARSDGPRPSVHPTGAAVDISKVGMSDAGKTWMRRRLAELECRGAIDATEEHYQRAFHVMVAEKYAVVAQGTQQASRQR